MERRVSTLARSSVHKRGAALLAAVALVLAACGSDDASEPDDPDTDAAAPEEEEPADVPVIPILADPSGTAIAVAADEGLFEGCEVDITQVGYGESTTLFLAGDTPVTLIAPHEIANEQSEGEDIVYFTTASALRFINGIVIRADDMDTYSGIPDLAGKTLGIPGFGTGTWSAFLGLAEARYGMDPTQEFEIVEAGPGALLGLLEAGEIDAALTFAAQAGAALGDPGFHLLTSFSQEWEDETGEPLTITGLGARTEWLENNVDAARCLVEGIDRGVDWMKENPDELRPGGTYADWVAGEGWHRDDATTDAIIEALQADQWYFKHADTYTQEWIESTYEFSTFTFTGSGDMPTIDELFFPADWSG